MQSFVRGYFIFTPCIYAVVGLSPKWALQLQHTGPSTGTSTVAPYRRTLWEVGQGLGMESHIAHSQHPLPAHWASHTAGACSPRSGNTHRGLRPRLQDGEPRPASNTLLLVPERLLQRNPYCLPYTSPRNQGGRFPHYLASSYRSTDPCADSPPH